MEQLLSAFTDELPLLIDAIALSLRMKDLAAATQHAHALKGTSANLSVDQISRWAMDLEMQLRRGDESGAHQMLSVLQANSDAAIAALKNAARAVRPAA